MNYAIIVNPNSGKKKSIKILNKIVIPKLLSNNHDYETYVTDRPLHASSLSKTMNFNNYESVILLGGDGTLHEFINGMMQREDKMKLPIGVVPTGSGNSFLMDFNISNCTEAMERILQNKKMKVDLLEVQCENNIYYSINLVGWGMVNDIGVYAEKIRWIGPIRYILSSIREIFIYNPKDINIIIDGTNYSDKYSFIIACNTIHIGKGMKMAPKALLNDGKMDLVIVKNNFSRLKLLQMLPKIFSGKHINSTLVEYLQVQNFEIKSANGDTLNIDGENIGRLPVKIRVKKEAISIQI